MAYPADYQEAEHRRALSSLLHDLESLETVEAGTHQNDEASASGDARPAGEPCPEAGDLSSSDTRADEDRAALHIRTARIVDVAAAPQSTN